MVEKLEIQELIDDMLEQGELRKVEILYELKKLNKDAYIFIRNNLRRGFKTAYRLLQKENCWKKAKVLLKEYFQEEEMLYCQHCQRALPKYYILHHETYGKDFTNYFTPIFLEILCSKCHAKHHNTS